jgi:hypothetical protein
MSVRHNKPINPLNGPLAFERRQVEKGPLPSCVTMQSCPMGQSNISQCYWFSALDTVDNFIIRKGETYFIYNIFGENILCYTLK